MPGMRSLRPDRFVYDGADLWRGGQVWAIAGGTSTIRLLAEANMVRDKSVATSLIPAGAQTVGCPVCCRVTGGGAETYTIVEIIGSSFGPQDGPRDKRGECGPW